MKVARPFVPAVLLALVTCLAASGQHAPNGLDPAALERLPERMKQFVADGTMAGAVTLVARNGNVAAIDALGFSDLAAKKPMKQDAIFWIASMTKPITATAVMMLQDEGRLNVEDPVGKYLPEFNNQWMVAAKSGDTLTLVRPPRPITLRDLLTHTSGLGSIDPPRPDCSLAELVMAYSQQPLRFPPGSKWEYSTAGINTLGRVVEVVSGEPFTAFLDKRLFRPLKMKDTTFWPTARQAKRVAKSYQPGNNGLEETEVYFLKGGLSDRSRTPFPGGGLYSTAADMARFYQMVLNGGELEGRRYVSSESVALMTRTRTGDLKTGFTGGMSFGLGWGVVREPQGITAALSPGTFGHGGAYGTQGWVDPQKNLILVLMIQRAKLPNADGSEVRRAFQEAAVAALR